jgi:CRISPR-associated protein Cmr1
VDAFPRAGFGLPIVFQFKDNDKSKPTRNTCDPRRTTLEMKGYERWASPIILRPLACAEEEAVGLVCWLRYRGQLPGPLVLKDGPHALRDAAGQEERMGAISPADALQFEPLRTCQTEEPQNGTSFSVVRAFFNWI